MRGQFRFKDGYTYRMPAVFRNYPFKRDVRVVYDDCRMICVEQRTEEEALAQYIPEDFEIAAPVVNWSYTNCRGVDFMMGGEYRIMQASAPVRYCGGKESIDGCYPLVIFENNAVPVLGGREEDGMPKVVCDISLDRHFENHWFAALSSDCETIMRMNFRQEAEMAPSAVEAYNKGAKMAAFGNRCLPSVDRAGCDYQDYILYPQEIAAERIFTGRGSVEVIAPAEWYIQPYFSQTLYALSGLPNLGFENALRIEGCLRLYVSESRPL